MKKLTEDIKENWKVLLGLPVSLVLVAFLAISVFMGAYNALVWVTPNECHEYVSWQELLNITLNVSLVWLIMLGVIYTFILFSYPLHWVSSKLPPMPKKIKAYFAARKKQAARKEVLKLQKRLNKPPTWWERNEPIIILTSLGIGILFILFMGIAEIVKFYYCI